MNSSWDYAYRPDNGELYYWSDESMSWELFCVTTQLMIFDEKEERIIYTNCGTDLLSYGDDE